VKEVGDIGERALRETSNKHWKKIQNILQKKIHSMKIFRVVFLSVAQFVITKHVPSLSSVLSCFHTPPVPTHLRLFLFLRILFFLTPSTPTLSMFSFRPLKFHSPLRDGAVETFALASVKQKSLQVPDRLLVCFVANCRSCKTYVALNSVAISSSSSIH